VCQFFDGRKGVDLGRGLHICDLGPRRVGDRGPHYGLHDLRDFIIAASKTYGDAIGNNEPKMPEIVDLYAMVNRMRVLGMRKTTASADVVMRSIIDTYFGPNRTVADLRELVRTGQGIDPLKDFSAAAREELRAFALL
jgi:hypothetical protein